MATADPHLRVEVADLDEPATRALERRQSVEISVRYGGDGESDLEPPIDAAAFRPPAGAFLVAWLGGERVGCAGLRQLGEGRGELKRLFVVPAARRRGVARALLRAVEETAAAAGYAELWLETGTAQPEALQLYETEGYHRIPSYGQYRDYPESRCFARTLPVPPDRGG